MIFKKTYYIRLVHGKDRDNTSWRLVRLRPGELIQYVNTLLEGKENADLVEVYEV